MDDYHAFISTTGGGGGSGGSGGGGCGCSIWLIIGIVVFLSILGKI